MMLEQEEREMTQEQRDDALEQIKTEINTAKKDYLSKLL